MRVSFPMLINPFILGIAIMIPDRNLYLLYLVLILLAYTLRTAFSDTYNLLAQPIRIGLKRMTAELRNRMHNGAENIPNMADS